IVRTKIRVLAAFVDEAIPDVDINRAGAFGARAVKVVEIDRVGRRFGAADRRQPDPEHRHALAFKGSDRLVDPLFIDLGPLVRSKLNYAIGLGAGLLFGRDDRLLVRLVGLIFGLVFILRVLVGGLGGLILVFL